MRSSAASASTSARRRVSFLSRAAVSGSRRLARYRSRMFFRRSAASRRTRSRSALNSSPCTYSLTRFTRASVRSSEMISAEVCLKNLLAMGLLLLLPLIVPPGRLRDVSDDDTPTRARAFEAGEVHTKVPGLVPGCFCRFRFCALSRASISRWTRDIAGLVHDLSIRRCVLWSPRRLGPRFQRLAEELGAVLQGFQYLAEDSPHVVQARLQLGLGFDALDPKLHLAQLRFEADIDLDQIREHSLESYPNLQVLDLQVDLLHVERRHVQHYVGITVGFPAVLRVVDGVIFVPARTPVVLHRRTLPTLRLRPSGCHNPSSLQNVSLLVCRAPPTPLVNSF